MGKKGAGGLRDSSAVSVPEEAGAARRVDADEVVEARVEREARVDGAEVLGVLERHDARDASRPEAGRGALA